MTGEEYSNNIKIYNDNYNNVIILIDRYIEGEYLEREDLVAIIYYLMRENELQGGSITNKAWKRVQSRLINNFYNKQLKVVEKLNEIKETKNK